MPHPIARSTLWRAVATAGALLAAHGAQAQDVTDLGLEEIVVTAQKRTEDVQAVPISISALSATDLERRGLNNSQDLIGTLPNVAGFTPPGAKGNLSVSLRGVSSGSPSNLSVDTASGLYIDGVFLGKQIGSSLDVMELERIEVLRGPQGTLYGRNSTGGAVNFITRKPTGEFGGKITGTLGNENLRGVKVGVDTSTLGAEGTGLGTLKASFGAQMRERDGWYENAAPGNGDKLDELDRQAWRAALRWEPTSSITIDYGFDHSELDETNTAQVPVGITQLNAAGLSRVTALQGYVQAGEAALLGFGPLATAANALGGDATFQRWLGSAREMLGQFQALGDGDRPDEAYSDTPSRTTNQVEGHTLTGAWALEDAGFLGDVEFKSISGWREVDARNIGDLDGFDNTIRPGGIGALNDSALGAMYAIYAGQGQVPGVAQGFVLPQLRLGTAKLWSLIDEFGGAFFTQDAAFGYEQFSQELQMVGSNGRLDYAVGLYYFEDDGYFSNYRLAAQPVGGISTTAYKNDTEAKALYTQFTWTPPVLDDRLALTGGYRRTEEEKGIEYLYQGDGGLFDGSPLNARVDLNYTGALSPLVTFGDDYDQSFGNDSFAVTAAFQATDDTNVFLRWSTGYRSGGYNGEIYNNPFEEETMEQWELGVKSDVIPGTLRVNASVFAFTYDDLQVSQIQVNPNTGQTTSFIGNAGKAERWGAELEAQWSPVEDVLVALAYAHMDGDFEEFPEHCGSGDAAVVGDEICLPTKNAAERPISPDDSLSLTTDWVFLRTDAAEFIAHVEAYWQDETFASTLWTGSYGSGTAASPNVPVIYDPVVLDDRIIVNARLGIENVAMAGGTLRAALWSRNLLDEDYNSYGINFASLGPVTEQYGEPRSWGLDVTWEF